jgi:hypothetical protein
MHDGAPLHWKVDAFVGQHAVQHDLWFYQLHTLQHLAVNAVKDHGQWFFFAATRVGALYTATSLRRARLAGMALP